MGRPSRLAPGARLWREAREVAQSVAPRGTDLRTLPNPTVVGRGSSHPARARRPDGAVELPGPLYLVQQDQNGARGRPDAGKFGFRTSGEGKRRGLGESCGKATQRFSPLYPSKPAMKTGRPPLPTKLKALRGTLRRHRVHPAEPLPTPGAPPGPRPLPAH